MHVSCIIPTLNEAANLATAVERAWRAGADEVIVADGGSRDESRQLARHLDCRWVSSRAGRGGQQNAGAAAATGDVLLFLHADNWLEPAAVDQIRQALAHPGQTQGAFEQRIEADGSLYRLLEWGNARRVRWWGLAYGDQGIFVSREVFERVGGFPDEPLMEDVALMRRLRQSGRPVLLPGPLHVSARRWQKHGVLRQTLRNWGLLSAYTLGVSPARLVRYYPRHIDAG